MEKKDLKSWYCHFCLYNPAEGLIFLNKGILENQQQYHKFLWLLQFEKRNKTMLRSQSTSFPSFAECVCNQRPTWHNYTMHWRNIKQVSFPNMFSFGQALVLCVSQWHCHCSAKFLLISFQSSWTFMHFQLLSMSRQSINLIRWVALLVA